MYENRAARFIRGGMLRAESLGKQANSGAKPLSASFIDFPLSSDLSRSAFCPCCLLHRSSFFAVLRSLLLLAPMAADPLEFLFDRLQLVVGHVFEIDHFVARAFHRVDEFIELQMKRLGIA